MTRHRDPMCSAPLPDCGIDGPLAAAGGWTVALRRSIARMLVVVFAWPTVPVYADPVPDPASAHVPRVDTVGGVTVVDIVRADARGVSHNVWTRFDVTARGLVLNNGVQASQSALAGALPANAALEGRAASTIVNEVTGSQPSALLGRIEVAGQAARLIIANPNGITCDGCGFVGTPHVQLTTGRPLQGAEGFVFDVEQGRIDIGAHGLDALAARLDLIARAIRTDGALRAGAVNAVAARASVDADTLRPDVARLFATDDEPQPVAIDIGQTVSAGSIQLIAIGGDIGVRTAAPLTALEGVLIASRQDVQILAPIYAGGDVELYTVGALYTDIAAPVRAGRDLHAVMTGVTVRGSGELSAGGDMHIGFVDDNADGWTGLDNAGRIEAARNMTLSGLVDGRNAGVMVAGGTLDAAGGSVAVPADRDGLPGTRSSRASGIGPAPVFMRNSGSIEAGVDLFLNATGNEDGVVHAGRDLYFWQSLDGQASSGRATAGQDLFLFAPTFESDAPPARGGRLFRAGRDLLLFDAPDPVADRATLAADVVSGIAYGQTGDTPDYVNLDTLAAGRDVVIALDAAFTNRATVEAARDLTLVARQVLNETSVRQRHFEVGHPYYEGCRTTYAGTCSVTLEQPGEAASLVAGRHLSATTQSFSNRGARVLAGGELRIDARDTLNEDRRYGADWTSTYWLIDPDAVLDGGTGCSSNAGESCLNPIDWQRSASGHVDLGVLPGVMQAGGGIAVGGPDGDGGASSPSPALPPGVSAGSRLADLADLLQGGTGSSFVNTGALHAASLSIHADAIRNGFDVVEDYYHRTAELALAPASIDVMRYGSAGSGGVPVGDYDAALLMALLPPALASNHPFALTPEQELAALRNAFIATTGRGWIVPGLSWDPVTGQSPEAQQRVLLAANGFAFAVEHGIPMGSALEARQQALIDAPMLWYVERDGELRPWVYVPEAWRAQLAAIPGGVLDVEASLSLAGRTVDNTGFMLAGGRLSVTAEELLNRKRSAYYYEEFDVPGGTLIVEGSQVQAGGFMQAGEWALDVDRIQSASGEFRVSGADEDETLRLSAAFEQGLADDLGERFVRTVARDDFHYRFEKDFGFGDVMGLATSFMVASMIGADVSSFIGSFAAPGSTFAAATATTAAGLGNTMVTAAISQGVSSSVGQWVATGSIDIGRALDIGLTSGLSAGLSQWTGTWLDDPLQLHVARLAGAGLIGAATGNSFESALMYSAIQQAAASGAGYIGDGVLGERGSLGHLLAHGALGALAESARGGDPLAGALGAMTATLVEGPLDQALGLRGSAQGEALLTALTMMAGGAVADFAGGNPLAGALGAQNATQFNFLMHAEQEQYAAAKTACGADAACQKSVDDQFDTVSQSNREALDDARATCNTTGYCTPYYSLMNEAMPLGMGVQRTDHNDPENPWLSDQQNAAAIAYNLQLYDQLMARTLQQEVVLQTHAPDPEAFQFSPEGSSQYVSAISARNTDQIVVLTGVGASLLLPGPEDLVVGAVLMTKAGQFVARVIEVGGQKLLRWADGGVEPAVKGTHLAFDAANRTWTSPAGLVYEQGSAHGNRVLHVLDHAVPNPSKPVHSVFNVSRSEVLGLLDEAWLARAGPGTVQKNGNRVWVVEMGRQVGTSGQTAIQIVVRDGTSRIVTAYPK